MMLSPCRRAIVGLYSSLDGEKMEPQLHVVPWGWWIPPQKAGTSAAVFARVEPIPVGKDVYQWGAVVAASTLIAVDDDALLRRILCHEFAHCFWFIARIVEGQRTCIDPI